MAGAMTRVNYHSDDGVTYTMRQDASNATAAGNPAAGAFQGLPKRYRPRFLLAAHPTTGRERRIQVSDATTGLWLGSVATITLPDFDNLMAPVVYIIRGRIGERRLG